jgi:hypothetical protein
MAMAQAIDFDYRPTADIADIARCHADPMWRVCSGALYKISVKSDRGDGQVIEFRPNDAQMDLLRNLWYRNVILKARQRGFTTLIAIMWLDHALFNAEQRCGIVAQDLEAAQIIFRDKVKLAYENLPDTLRSIMPLARDSASELLFAHNNSSVRVATSVRSGTIHRLHVSEFGKICAKFPEKAQEVITGSLPAVPLDGVVVIESTAEGRDGAFYSMSKRAQALAESKARLSERDYRFHFVPWWSDSDYALPHEHFEITPDDIKYFASVESKIGIAITPAQRRWYVKTRDSDFSGNAELMWQEYPSFPDEAFQVSMDGVYYAIQLSQARRDGRICRAPHVDGIPVNTYWDIGNSDGTAIWLHQKVGRMNRFVGFIEGWGEPYSYFGMALQELRYLWGVHWVPHDAEQRRQQHDVVSAPIDELRKMAIGGRWEVVPRVADLSHGIQLMRDAFSQCEFDEVACAAGIKHLEGYRKQWNERIGAWSSTPIKNEHTEAADALRQFAQSQTKLLKTDGFATPLPKRRLANIF